ncbi:MAG: secondary thiamine-phosphate synthase enzyme YjbQ [Candidatus Omnitrophica bacterium]|nr:secondary thiamine-phosphate synthase enzyme YjbQ [Candidatus Omnitrophota bacterium]MBU1997117.1 secondary thiamine-phosphate synthase enzyme YjbQ [Candidatus Omnitrophota bacterium]MBU4333414.1 secondary thiamine-phosphate synthase enzyme YjbQ [Candidatus Omnitrophota bacterium]
METLNISSKQREQIIDITPQIQQYISKNGYSSGILTVYSPHTTAGITVNENADPDVKKDITNFLNQKVPQNFGFAHIEGNSDAHIKASLMNFSYNFIVENGQVLLGTWQGIFFMEFDGPRNRNVWLKYISG